MTDIKVCCIKISSSLQRFDFQVFLLTSVTSSSKVLPKSVPKLRGPLCGSDFQNYPNLDRFMEAKRRHPELSILHRKYCRKICQIYQPICGSNMKSYHNECQLEYDKKYYKSLKLLYKGRCSYHNKGKSEKMQAFVAYDYFASTENNDEPVDCSLTK